MDRARFFVLAEDESDKQTIHAILRTLTGDPRLPRLGQGFGGCGDLLNRGARVIRGHLRDSEKFIICVDADGEPPERVREKVRQRVLIPSGISACGLVVPVQEIEAWILSDIDRALAKWKAHPSWTPAEVRNPEAIAKPKEALIQMSRSRRSKPDYVPALHNEHIAAHLDLVRVETKCPSFAPLRQYVMG